jgi:K+-sensing histidine kinase KdpD
MRKDPHVHGRFMPNTRPPLAAVLGSGLALAITAALIPVRDDLTVATPALVLVIPIVIAGLVGGRWPALITAVVGTVALNLAFITPYWTLKIDAIDDVVALVVFTAVAVAVGTLVAREGARRIAAEGGAVELAHINAELVALQEERQRLTEEANRVMVLEEIDEQRAALLRSVSHDLRTPLATIRAVASDLLSDASYDPQTTSELLALVADEAERLDRLVANLLSLSRIEAGALQPDRQAVAMEELLAHALARHSRVLRRARVAQQVPSELPLVDGDYTQIDQVVSNLLENAARHAPPGSVITVGARANGGSVEVWVDDEGIGVTPFERRRIFEPFRRGEGSESSGVGLAICKAIVEAHGGTIEATSAPAGGARFCFTLPVRDA